MASLSLDLSSSAKTVKHEMIWRNWKATLLIVLAVILAVYILMVIFCGGFTLSGCF
jgi:vesicle-associated membrane protein 7